MKKFLIFVIISSFLLIGVVGFSQKFVNAFPTIPNVKYGGTLRIVTTWGPVAFNLNPFLPSGQSLGVGYVMYGTRFLVNSYTQDMTPFFGTNYTWKDNYLKLAITVRQGIKWSDGQPFTPEDVAFTFNYLKKYPALDTGGIWSKNSNLQSIIAFRDTVVFTFSKPNTPLLLQITQVPIVPQHIWSSIANPTKFLNPDPVVAGPLLYLKNSYNSANYSFELVRNPNFWMKGKPFIDKIEVRSLIGGQPLLYLLRGDADWSYYGSGINPNVLWHDKDPAVNKFWWPTASANILYLNTQKYSFNIVAFRKAISMAIDRKSLEDKAYFGTGGYDQSPTGIIPANQKAWLDPTLTVLASSLNTYNIDKAQKTLATVGFTKNAQGQLVGPDGKELPTFKILVGAGWGDFITMAQIISSNLEQLGIRTVTEQEPWDTYISSVMSGTYDMVISWSTGGPTPYYLYYYEFNPSFSATKMGETALSDRSRYTNPLITAALQAFSETNDLRIQKQAIYTIVKNSFTRCAIYCSDKQNGFHGI